MVESSPGSWRHLAAKLGWTATALAVIAVLVLGAGVWAFVSEKIPPGSYRCPRRVGGATVAPPASATSTS